MEARVKSIQELSEFSLSWLSTAPHDLVAEVAGIRISERRAGRGFGIVIVRYSDVAFRGKVQAVNGSLELQKNYVE